MLKVIGIGLLLALVSTGANADRGKVSIEICGEITDTVKALLPSVLKTDDPIDFEDLTRKVSEDSIRRNGKLKEGRPGYLVQQSLFFLEDNWAEYSTNITYFKRELVDHDVVISVVSSEMTTLCYKRLS